MSRILILGGKGLLGGALARAFADHDVTVWDRTELDITDESSAREKITALRPDVIINCAAWNDVDGAERNPEAANALNGTAVGALGGIAKSLGVPMVHYSTDYVFDGMSPAGYTEDSRPNPVNAYARSKALGEELLARATDAHYLIRTSRLYGPLPESPGAKPSFVLRIIAEARASKDLPVVHEEPGSFTYVKDLAEATRTLIESHASHGIYHLIPEGEATWYDCAREIVDALGLPTVVRPIPRSMHPVKRAIPPYTVLRSTKVPYLREWKTALRDFLSTSLP